MDAITADYHDGVLTVSLPLAEGAKPRRIALSGGSAARELGAGSGPSDPARQGSRDHARHGVLTRLVPRRWRGRHVAERVRDGLHVPVRRSKSGAS